MSSRIIVLVTAALAAVSLVAAFLVTHERVEIDSYRPAEGEARYNPLLAAERLLQTLGYNASAEAEFAPGYRLPAITDTAVITFNYQLVRREDMELLLDWVSAGGHLIVEIRPLYGRPVDPIFTPYGISVTTPEYDIESLGDIPDSDEQDENAEPDDDLKPLFERFEGRSYWGDMSLDNKRHIDFGNTETIWTVADESGVFAGEFGVGSGRITAVTDLAFATNRWIGQKDHAYILTRLIDAPATAGKIWLYYGQQFPSLFSLVWQRADFLLKALALIVLLGIWRASAPFGPRIQPEPAARKAFLEHIAASGRFLWRRQAHAALHEKTVQAFVREFERHHPSSRGMDTAARHRLIAEVCQTTVEKVDNALSPPSSRSHAEFTDKMQQVKTLWTTL